MHSTEIRQGQRCPTLLEQPQGWDDDPTGRVQIASLSGAELELHRALIEQSPDAIFVVQRGEVVYRNSTHEKWFGFPRTETTLFRLATHAVPADSQRAQAYDQALSQGKQMPDPCTMTLCQPAGRAVHLEVWARTMTYQERPATVVVLHRLPVSQPDDRTGFPHQRQRDSRQDDRPTVQHFEDIIGTSPAIQRVLQDVEQVARTESTVLITGETGTGKELIVRALHRLSRRCTAPLIKVNCSALPSGLIESELFGHEKGAFTGALERRIGRFELAHGGTLFLDEIGDMPLDVQVKLLRALQEREFERLGGSRTLSSDVRVIAATHRDLQQAVAEQRFRADLYYRLHVFPLHLPALRDRHGDIPLLVRYFVDKYSAKLGKHLTTVAPTTMECLQRYPWPGNIRELEHVIERAVIVARGTTLAVDASWLPVTPVSCTTATRTLDEVERDYIVQILAQTHGVVEGPKGAARLLNLHPNTLRGRMHRLGITRPPASA